MIITTTTTLPHTVLMEGQTSASPLSLLDHEVVGIVTSAPLLPLQKKPVNKANVMDKGYPPRERDSWSEGAIYTLLDHFTKKYVLLNRGNLRTRDWSDVAQRVSMRSDGKRSRKTSEQCKNKIDNLKKQYKKEKSKKDANGSRVKSWVYYNRMDGIFGGASHLVHGLPGGVDAGNCSLHNCGNESNVADGCEIASPSPLIESPKMDPKDDSRLDLDDVCHSPMRKLPKISTFSGYLENGSFESSIGKDLKEGLLGLADVFQKIETAKMEMQMDVERLRAEMELQRTQMMLNVQLQIAKCLGQNRKRRFQSSDSSSSG